MLNINPLLYSFDENKDKVSSSNIEMCKYCNITNTLFVKFAPDSIYLYSAIPPSVWRSFNMAESKGKFFYRKIKGAYPYIKLQ